MCASIEQINSIAIIDDNSRKLINEFLPGGLTLILKSREEVYLKIGYKTIGVRIPNCKIALNILQKNGPMLTTSVNDSGAVPINEYEEIVQKYSNLVDEIYQANEDSSNLSSTVVSVIESEVKILREGAITAKDINRVLNV